MARKRFTGVLAASDRGGGHWIEVPFDAKAEFGSALAPVRGTANEVAADAFGGLAFTHRKE